MFLNFLKFLQSAILRISINVLKTDIFEHQKGFDYFKNFFYNEFVTRIFKKRRYGYCIFNIAKSNNSWLFDVKKNFIIQMFNNI